MKYKGQSCTPLSSILSTPKGSTLSGITNKTFEDIEQEIATDGHPALEPIWIQSAHLQLANSDWSKMTFNPAYGLDTISPKSSNTNKHWPLLDDADLLNTLPESSIADVDPTEFKKITQKGLDEITPTCLDEITPVPVTITGQSELSRHGPPTKPPPVIQPSTTDHAKTLRPPRQQRLQNQIEQKAVSSYPRPRILKEVEFNKAPRMSSRKVKPPVSKQVLPNKRGARKPTRSLLNAMKPGFNNQDLRKMFGLMKKLDTENPILTTEPEVALMMAQQRQQWLQALNIVVANLNKKESGTIFALYHKYPFPRYPNPVVSESTEDTTNPLCESNHFYLHA